MPVAPEPAEPEAEAEHVRRVFSTSAMPPAARLRGWEEHNEHTLFSLSASTLAPEGLLAQQANRTIGRLHLTEIGGNTHVIERTPRRISDKPADTVMMCLLLHGDAFIYHRGGFEPIRAGDAVLYDSDSPFLYGFNGRNHQVIVEVPRTVFHGRIAGSGVPTPRVLRLRDDELTARWSAQAARLVREALRTPGDVSPQTEEQLLTLKGLLVDPSTAGANGHVLAAQEFVRAHLGDVDLSAARIAGAVGMSERHLRRQFAERGDSLAHYVVEQRMRRARALLTAPGAPPSIADVSRAVGYVSPAHFSRAFRVHFGETPSDARAAAA